MNQSKKQNIGILIHGRHLYTKEWERMIWGEPPSRLGVLPRAVLEILIRGYERVAVIVLGTGSSEKDGLKEAEYTKKYLLEHIERLAEFTEITKHPDFVLSKLKPLLDAIICETRSQNTAEETSNAAKIFSESGCVEVYQVTGASHMPRAILEMLKVRAKGGISPAQRWYGAPDDMTYVNSSIDDVVVVEPPHRGDDPMMGAPLKIHQVISQFFSKTREEQTKILHALRDALK